MQPIDPQLMVVKVVVVAVFGDGCLKVVAVVEFVKIVAVEISGLFVEPVVKTTAVHSDQALAAS